jgi:hypothetical protein
MLIRTPRSAGVPEGKYPAPDDLLCSFYPIEVDFSYDIVHRILSSLSHLASMASGANAPAGPLCRIIATVA